MDDGKRENNEIKRSKSENVKTVVSVYLHRRQFSNLKAKRISKRSAIKRAILDNTISKTNSILYNYRSSDLDLVIEYSFMFQKFIYWLKDQIKYKNRCHDVEKLVGPLFCHFYMDILSSDQSDKAITFYKAHVDKVDKLKCDDTVKDFLKAIANSTADSLLVNGSDGLNFDELKEKLRSSKVVTEIKEDSLNSLKNFISKNSHIVFLQALQTWFDLKIETEANSIGEVQRVSKSTYMKHDSKDQAAKMHVIKEQKSKIKSVIKKVKRLPASVCNIRILNNKHTVTCGIIRRQAGYVAFAERNILRIMPLQALDPICGVDDVHQIQFIHHSRQIYCLALSPKNDIICSGSADHTICIYNLKKLSLFKRLKGHLGPVYCIAISDNSKYLASGSQDGTARLWSLKTGNTLRVFAGHTDAVTSVHFHPNTLYVATGSADKNIRVWCLKSANTVRLLHAAKKVVFAVAFDPNGQYLACASDDKKVRIWDLASSKVVHEFRNRESSVLHVLWSKTGKHLCGGTVSGVVKIWDISHKEKDKDRDKDKEHSKEHKHSDSVLRRRVNGRLIGLEYSHGTWTCMSLPKTPPF